MGFFSAFGTSFHSMVGEFSRAASASLIQTLGPIFASALIIYLIVYGWLIGSGRVQGSMGESVILAAKLTFVCGLGLNAGNFITYVIPLVDHFQNILLSVASSGFKGTSQITNPWEAIDKLWNTFTDGWETINGAISKLNWITAAATIIALIVCEVVMGIISVLFTFSAAGVLLINETALAVILGFGPLFICTLMFPPLKSWFDGWFKSMVTFAFTLVISATVTALFSSVFSSCLDKINVAAEAEKVQVAAIGLPLMNFCVLALIGATFIKQVPTITAALTGGMNMGAAGLGQMLHSAGQTTRSVAGGLALGAGTTMGSEGAKNFGRSLLGSQGLGVPGALSMAAVGGVGGVAARAAKQVYQSTNFSQSQSTGSPEDSARQATARSNAETAARIVEKRKNKRNKNE